MGQQNTNEVLKHVSDHGLRGFNKTQLTHAINDATTAETLRALMSRLDTLKSEVAAISREIEKVVDCLSVLEIRETALK